MWWYAIPPKPKARRFRDSRPRLWPNPCVVGLQMRATGAGSFRVTSTTVSLQACRPVGSRGRESQRGLLFPKSGLDHCRPEGKVRDHGSLSLIGLAGVPRRAGQWAAAGRLLHRPWEHARRLVRTPFAPEGRNSGHKPQQSRVPGGWRVLAFGPEAKAGYPRIARASGLRRDDPPNRKVRHRRLCQLLRASAVWLVQAAGHDPLGSCPL